MRVCLPQVSLYFDMLLSLAKDVCQEDYETGSRPGSYGHGSTISAGSSRFDDSSADRRRARVMVWRRLRHGGVSMQAGACTGVCVCVRAGACGCVHACVCEKSLL